MLCGGERPAKLDEGCFLQPAIFAGVPEAVRIWREEIFGPILTVRIFHDEAEALRLANDTAFGLAAAVMSADRERCRWYLKG